MPSYLGTRTFFRQIANRRRLIFQVAIVSREQRFSHPVVSLLMQGENYQSLKIIRKRKRLSWTVGCDTWLLKIALEIRSISWPHPLWSLCLSAAARADLQTWSLRTSHEVVKQSKKISTSPWSARRSTLSTQGTNLVAKSSELGHDWMDWHPPPPPSTIKTEHRPPRSCEASSPTKITSSLGCRSRDALRAAKVYEHRAWTLLHLRVLWLLWRSTSIKGLSFCLLLASDTTLSFSLVFLARWSPWSCTVMLGVHMKYIQLCSLCVDLFVCAAVESLWSLFHEFVQ